MTSTTTVVANPAPGPARPLPAPGHEAHDALSKARHHPIHPSLDTVLAGYAGGNFVGGHMGLSFGS